MISPDPKIVYQAFLLPPFARADRKLAADPKAWIETHVLIAEIRKNAREPIPESVLAHLKARLDGTARKRQGRGRQTPLQRVQNKGIAAAFDRREAWLMWRAKTSGLVGWPRIRSAEWWQGPPSERAARMVQRSLRLSISWERVRNIAYEARKVPFKGIHEK